MLGEMDPSRPALSAYRRCDAGDELLRLAAQRPLREAGDALSLVLLCLESQDEEDSSAARQRAIAQARSFLGEAVNALNRARVYVPEVFSYTASVIAAAETDPAAELARLHQLTTRLLWYNHRFLPTRRQTPLRPEDEAQLAVLVRTLSRATRAGRALRHAWIAGAATLAVMLPLGPAAVALALAGFLALAWTLQVVSTLRSSPALPEQI